MIYKTKSSKISLTTLKKSRLFRKYIIASYALLMIQIYQNLQRTCCHKHFVNFDTQLHRLAYNNYENTTNISRYKSLIKVPECLL